MKLLILAAVAVATPVFAGSTNGVTEDHYREVISRQPYNVEVCNDVNVPYGRSSEFNGGGAIVGGIIGGVIGNQFGKGQGKEVATGIGALTGAIIGGNNKGSPQGYRTETQCRIETRYNEGRRSVYSHSTITFWDHGRKYTLRYTK